MLSVRALFVAFANKCGDVVASNSGMGVLRSWESQVPDGIKTKRKGGVALSTHRATLDIELYAPLWLQRQRLMFELLYHNLALNLYRPFLCFPSTFAENYI